MCSIIFKHISDQLSSQKHGRDSRIGLDNKFPIAHIWNMAKHEMTMLLISCACWTCCQSDILVTLALQQATTMPTTLPTTAHKDNPHPPRHHVAPMQHQINPSLSNGPSHPRTTTAAQHNSTTASQWQQRRAKDATPRKRQPVPMKTTYTHHHPLHPSPNARPAMQNHVTTSDRYKRMTDSSEQPTTDSNRWRQQWTTMKRTTTTSVWKSG